MRVVTLVALGTLVTLPKPGRGEEFANLRFGDWGFSEVWRLELSPKRDGLGRVPLRVGSAKSLVFMRLGTALRVKPYWGWGASLRFATPGSESATIYSYLHQTTPETRIKKPQPESFHANPNQSEPEFFPQGRARASPARTSGARRRPLPATSKQLKPNQAPPLPSMGQRDSIRGTNESPRQTRTERPTPNRASSLRCEEQNQSPRQRNRASRYGDHSSPCGHHR